MEKKLLTGLFFLSVCAGAAVLVNQGFEKPEFFAVRNNNGYTTGAAQGNGKWVYVTEKHISDVQSAEGNFSLRYKKEKERGQAPASLVSEIKKGEKTEIEFWFFREKENNPLFQLSGKSKEGQFIRYFCFGVWDKSRQYAWWNNQSGKYVRTGKPVPEECWIRVQVILDWNKKTVVVKCGDSDVLEKLFETILPDQGVIRSLDFSALPDSAMGSSFFVDELVVRTVK